MRLRRRLTAISTAIAVTIGSQSHVLAGTTHYYYDTVGRVLGVLSTADEQRTSHSDAADNPSYLHVFPTYAPANSYSLTTGGVLVADQTLVSGDGRFTFVIQEDGNAVVYEGSTPLWGSGSQGHQPGYFILYGDGNLYLNGPDDTVLWHTSISGATSTNATLSMQSDGNLVLYENGKPVWASNTGGH